MKINLLSNFSSGTLFPVIFLKQSFFILLCIATPIQAKQHNDAQLLKNAIAHRESGEHQAAINILETLQSQYIDHKRVNIELAINYITLKKSTQAEDILKHLQTLKLNPAERKKITRLQQKIVKTQKVNQEKMTKSTQHKYWLEVLAFIGTDSLTSQFPIYEYLQIDEGQEYTGIESNEEEYYFIGRSTDKQKQKNTYLAQQFKTSYRYKSNTRFNFLGSKSYFLWSNHLDLYQQQIENKTESKFQKNFQQIKFDSSFSILSMDKWFFDLRFRSRSHQNSDRTYDFGFGEQITTQGIHLKDNGLQLSLSLPIKTTRLKFGVEYKKKSFNEINRFNNSTATIPWLEIAIPMSNSFKLHMGSRYRNKSATDPYNSYKNHNIYASLFYYQSKVFSTSLTINHNRLHYNIDDPELVNWSTEYRKSLSIGLKYRFENSINIGLNSHFIKTNKAQDNGEDEWYRIETSIGYRF